MPVLEPDCKTIGSHRQEGVYVDFDSPSVIRYASPKTGTLHKAQFKNCQFDERVFPSLTSTGPTRSLEFSAPETFTLNLDPQTRLADFEVQKLLKLKALAEKLSNGFSNSSRITRNPLLEVGQPSLSTLPDKDHLLFLLPLAKKSRSSHYMPL